MFYTKAARIVAVIALALGALSVLIGLAATIGVPVVNELGQPLGNKYGGQFIDRGVYSIAFGVCIGVLSEISESLSKKNTDNR